MILLDEWNVRSKLITYYLSIIDLQCVNVWCSAKWCSYIYSFSCLFHYGPCDLLKYIYYSSLSYTVGACCLSILYMVFCICQPPAFFPLCLFSMSVSYPLLLLLLSRFSCVRPCVTPQTAIHQAPPSLGFSRQEYWSGLPFPSPMHESEKWKWSHSVVTDS